MEGKNNTPIVTLSAKVYEEHRDIVLNFAKTYPSVREGFSEIAKRIHKTQEEPQTIYVDVPSEKNIEQVFEYASFSSFKEGTDTSIVETIKRALAYANEAKRSEVKEPVLLPGHHLEFDEETEKKLTALRRILKSKGQIPKDATEKQFLEQLFKNLFEKHIDNKYEFLNKS